MNTSGKRRGQVEEAQDEEGQESCSVDELKVKYVECGEKGETKGTPTKKAATPAVPSVL